MKKRMFGTVGAMSYWLSWPLLWAYMNGTDRTRVLLITNREVLLVRNWLNPSIWSLPGGGIHKNEAPIDAASRELYEETRIALGVDQMQSLGVHPFRQHGIQIICHYFAAPLKQTVAAIPRPPELLEAEWVPLTQLDSYKLGKDVQEALRAWREK